ncbi:DUF2939 domain-containing protein [Stenotrophomonas sp. 24(2023)]|uniref:DUF2939 domain-containing protein n=1 Tax=Stenotrophomonas sp. 24(2023) TaxID=3068324 RepID=UPI0027E0F026|nr:DUF2939 domain-containing protein [Stenotrophomonas sp. 24(2023)]WMJ69720.1 DUF2939 domain-containing protein [Stenotrophomonas sp. 24(2023)]
MKRLIAILLLVLLASAAGWFSGPYLAVHGLSQAIEERDSARLVRYVDFPSVRASLRAQFNDYLVRQAGPDVAASPFGALLYGLGDQVGGAAVDTLVTPMGIGAMLQGHVLWKRGRNELQGGDAWAATEPAQPLKRAHHHFERLNRFVVDVDRGPGQPPLQVVLEPQGLRWKVVELRLGLAENP